MAPKTDVASIPTAKSTSATDSPTKPQLKNGQASKFLNVQDILVQELGWEKEFFGPIGQSYSIDIGSDGYSILTLHPIISGNKSKNIKTQVCDLFETGRLMTLSSGVFENYSETKAKEARNNYFLKGQGAIKDAEWLLMDKLAWLTYVSEGFQSHLRCVDEGSCKKVAKEYFDRPFEIVKCESHFITARVDDEKFIFPNLILTMPQHLYLSTSQPSALKVEKEIGEPFEDLFDRFTKNGEAIAASFVRLSETNRLNGLSFIEAYSKIFDQEISPENLIFLGSLCSLEEIYDACDETILMLIEMDNVNVALDIVRERFIADADQTAMKRVQSIDVLHFGRQYRLPLPEGFCDATGTDFGKTLLDILDETHASLPMLPIHYFVFEECEYEYGAAGYVALSNLAEITSSSQSEFNDMVWGRFTSSIREILRAGSASQDSVLKQIDFSKYGKTAPDIIVSGPNNTISFTQSIDEYDEQTSREFTFTSSTVLPNAIVYYYIITAGDGAGYEIGADKWVDILDRNSIKLKRMN